MIEIDIDFSEFDAGLGRLATLTRDMTPVTRELSEVLVDASALAFRKQADPVTGAGWHPLSAITWARRVATGHDGPPLQVSGQLKASVQADHGPDFATAGTNKAYVSTHQLGAKQGQYGRSKRGGPIPWGDIPARPFLGIGDYEREEIRDIIAMALRKALEGA